MASRNKAVSAALKLIAPSTIDMTIAITQDHFAKAMQDKNAGRVRELSDVLTALEEVKAEQAGK